MINNSYTSDPLLFFIIRLGRLVTNRMSQTLEKEDQKLMGSRMGILHDLMVTDGARQQDLAISSLKDKATIARSLCLLEKEGMVLRSPDPTDRRTKRIYITPKGRQFFQRVIPTGLAIIEEAKEGISSDDLSASIKVLQKMYNNLNK